MVADVIFHATISSQIHLLEKKIIEDLTLVSYITKPRKLVVPVSSAHHGHEIAGVTNRTNKSVENGKRCKKRRKEKVSPKSYLLIIDRDTGRI